MKIKFPLLLATISLLLTASYILLAQNAHAGTIIHPPAYLGLQNGLVGCWNFDGSYTKAPDCSGNGNTGTLVYNPMRVTGKIGQALDFNGVTDYISLTSALNNLKNPTGTVSAWVKLSSEKSESNSLFNISMTTSDYVFTIELGNNATSLLTNELITIIRDNGSVGNRVGYTTSTRTELIDNQWHHIIVTADGSSYAIYLDGVSKNLTVGSGANDGSFTDISSSNNARIGKRYFNTYDGFGFDGSIDDTRIYNRALAANEIARLYKIGLGSKQNEVQGGDQLDKGLVGHWTFDGADIGLSGTQAKDRSGLKNHGTLTNGPKQAIGRLGQALSFDGVNDYVDITPSTDLRDLPTTYNFTISVWAKCNDTAADMAAFSWWGTDDLVLYPCDNSGSGSGVRVFWRDLGGNIIDENGIDRSGEWFHFVFVSRASNDHKVYINSDKVISSSATGGAGPFSDLYIADFESSLQDFPGSIDDVRVYNRALSAGEVNRLYMMGQPKINVTQTTLDKGLVGHWTFDGADIGLSGTQAKDRSGQKNHGTLTNGPKQVIGRLGQALSFDGVDDYVAINNSTGLNITSNTISISLWVNGGTQGTFKYLLSKYTGGAYGYGLYTGSIGNLKFFFANGAGTYISSDIGSGVWNNSWHHVVATYDGANIKQYIDGVQKTTDPFTGNIADSGSTRVCLGAFNCGSTYKYTSSLDDVRIYNRALTAGEVNKLWQMGR